MPSRPILTGPTRQAASRGLTNLHCVLASHSYGYDPLSLGESTEQVEKYREFELLHGRWAMLGAFGCFVPEGIAANGGDIPGAVWWEARAEEEALSYTLPSLHLFIL